MTDPRQPIDRAGSRGVVRVIGVGNAWRCDDGAGLAAADTLRSRIDGIEVIEESGEGAALMQAWEGAASVFVIDAARAGSAPGTIHRFDATAERIPSNLLHYSTHAFGVAEAIEMARALGTLPGHLVLYGIEGLHFGAGTGLSDPVAAAVDRVVEAIVAECRSLEARDASKAPRLEPAPFIAAPPREPASAHASPP